MQDYRYSLVYYNSGKDSNKEVLFGFVWWGWVQEPDHWRHKFKDAWLNDSLCAEIVFEWVSQQWKQQQQQ